MENGENKEGHDVAAVTYANIRVTDERKTLTDEGTFSVEKVQHVKQNDIISTIDSEPDAGRVHAFSDFSD